MILTCRSCGNSSDENMLHWSEDIYVGYGKCGWCGYTVCYFGKDTDEYDWIDDDEEKVGFDSGQF